MTSENLQLNLFVGQEISSEFDVNSLENTELETTGPKPTKSCIDCGTKLVLGDNWTEARQAQGKYVCKPCWHEGARAEMYVNGKYVSKTHPLWKPGRYKTFEDAAFSSLKNYKSSKEGEVYIIVNPAWPEWVKIGMAVDAEDRCTSYQTGSPYRDYTLVCSYKAADRRKAESKAHKLIEKHSQDRLGEWFKITAEAATDLLSTLKEVSNEQNTTD